MSMTLEEAIKHAEYIVNNRKYAISVCWSVKDCEQLAEWLKELAERRKLPEIIRCKECIFYDPPHVENKGVRIEYKDLPKEAFDELGTGLVSVEYGINVGGRCERDYNASYEEDKRVFVREDNFCGRAERRTDDKG